MFTSEQKKIIALSSLGGALEFYDFIIFVFFAKILGGLFFPAADKTIVLMETFALFAVGYLMRPIGGIIFGHLGDKLGRKTTFIATVLLMAIPTFLIGCLPTYQHIGFLAPLALLVLRLLQGLSVGGEIPGAIVFVTETVPTEHRGFACAIVFFGVNLGLLLGSLVSTLFIRYLSSAELMQWGWRIPFLLGGALGILSFYLRKKLRETPLFSSLQQAHLCAKLPIKEVLLSFPTKIIQGAVMAAVGATLVSLLYLFMPTYLSTFFSFTLKKVSTLNTFMIAIFSLQVVLMGYISDKLGYLKMMRIGLVGLTIISYPLYKFFGLHDFVVVTVCIAILSFISSFITSTFPTILVSLYPTRVRYSGVAIVYNLGFGVVGGLMPMLVTSLIYWTHNLFVPGICLAATALIALVTTLFMRELRSVALSNQ